MNYCQVLVLWGKLVLEVMENYKFVKICTRKRSLSPPIREPWRERESTIAQWHQSTHVAWSSDLRVAMPHLACLTAVEQDVAASPNVGSPNYGCSPTVVTSGSVGDAPTKAETKAIRGGTRDKNTQQRPL